MQEQESSLQFDFESYLASLMEAMDMAEMPSEVQKEVTLQLGKQLGYRLMSTLALNFENEDWAGLSESKHGDDLSALISEAIDRNPEIKEKVVDELDLFYNETLEAYYSMK